MPFDPNKLAAAKQGLGPSFDSSKLQKFKDAQIGSQPTTPGAIPTVGDMALKAAKGLGMVSQGELDFARGAKRGFMGQDGAPQSISEKFGRLTGENAGALGGAAAAGLATGGMGLAPAAGMAFLGAAGGEGAQQLAQRALGGNAPETAGDASVKMLKQGLSNVLAESGVRLGGKALDVVLSMMPDYAAAALKMPAESVKRAIQKAIDGKNIIPAEGPAARAMIEKQGVQALKDTQMALVEARKAAGEKVGQALEDLHTATKGKKVFDVGTAAQNTRKYMQEKFQTTDPTILAAAKSDIGKIEEVLQTMEKGAQGAPGVRPTQAGLRDAKTVVQIKKTIQNLTNYARKGVPEISTDIGQDVLAHMGRELRQSIEQTAETLGHGGLKVANANAKQVYDLYDELRPMLATTRNDPYTLLRKFGTLAGDFNAGGMRQELVQNVAKQFPEAAKHVEKLLDAVSARAFTQHAAFAPSSATLTAFIRALMTPQNLGKAVENAAMPGAGKTGAKMLTRASIIMGTPSIGLSPENLKAVLTPPEEDK